MKIEIMNTPRIQLPVVLFCAAAVLGLAVSKSQAAGSPNIWTGASGNLLWSSPENWSAGWPAELFDSAQFDNAAGFTNQSGLVNNVVDMDSVVQQLWYSPIAPAYHTTLINPGVTLRVDDPSLSTGDILAVRLNTVPETTVSHVKIAGEGQLIVGDLSTLPPSAANKTLVRIHAPSALPGPYWATLDLSELNYFACATSELRVGANGSSAGTQGTLILAKTNLIVVGSSTPQGTYVGFTIGHTSATGAGGDYPSAGDVQLGQENILRAYSLRVGSLRATNSSLGGPGGGVGGASKTGAGGTMEFREGLVNPTLQIRGVDGGGVMQNLLIGDNTGLSGLGSSTNMSTGVMDLTGGKVDILLANLQMGRNDASATASRTGAGSGILTWTDGIIEVTNLVRIGVQAGNNAGRAYGVVNVRNQAVLRATGPTFNIGNDTGTSAGIGDGILNIENGGVVEAAANIAEVNGAGGDGSSTINVNAGYLDAAAAITVDNIHLANGVISNVGPATVATLIGNGKISGPVVVTGRIEPGPAIETVELFDSLELGAESTNVFEVDFGTLACDKVTGLDSVTLGGTLVVRNVGGTAAMTNGASVALFAAESYQGTFTAADLPELSAGLYWETSSLANGVLKITNQSPSTTLSVQVTGNTLGLSWPASHQGWCVQSNSIGLWSAESWFDIEESKAGTSYSINMDPSRPNVFFRLRQ